MRGGVVRRGGEEREGIPAKKNASYDAIRFVHK